MWGEISDKTKFCLDAKGKYVPEATTFLLVGRHLDYLLAMLNSSLSEYLFSKIGTTTGVGTVRWKKFKIEQLAVAPFDKQNAQHRQLANLNSKIVNEKEINQLVYAIYDLSKEETSYIESQTLYQ